MHVIHHSRRSGESLDRLVEESDVISLHCPLTPETHHMMDAAMFRKMKPSAFLINTARGSVVDESALVHALQAREIAGAGLDVFDKEPTIHPGLLQSDKVILLPHIGSATWRTRKTMAEMCARNLIAGLNNEPLPNRVQSS